MPDQPHIVATGVGAVNGTPDRCIFRAKLNVMAGTAADALDRCAQLAAQAIAALHEHEVSSPDVRTNSVSVQEFIDPAEKRVTARVASYQLDVTIKRLADAGSILGALSDVAGDSLQVQALNLTLADPGPLRREARRLAVLDAQRTAEDLAGAAGVRLGQLLSIRGVFVPAGPRFPVLASGGIAALPVEPGETVITSSVELTYAIDE